MSEGRSRLRCAARREEERGELLRPALRLRGTRQESTGPGARGEISGRGSFCVAEGLVACRGRGGLRPRGRPAVGRSVGG